MPKQVSYVSLFVSLVIYLSPLTTQTVKASSYKQLRNLALKHSTRNRVSMTTAVTTDSKNGAYMQQQGSTSSTEVRGISGMNAESNSAKFEQCKKKKKCTTCTQEEGCAWCKNLNACVQEKGGVNTCSTSGRRLEGLFAPLNSDHVSHHSMKGSEIGRGTCGNIINTENGLYHVHPDQRIVMSCEFIEKHRERYGDALRDAEGTSNTFSCCGDGECGDVETPINCPDDCHSSSQNEDIVKTFVLDNRHLSHSSNLFGDEVESLVEHPMYHCHQSYENVEQSLIKWFLDRPSHDLKAEMESHDDIQLAPGSQVLELGCGDGRDSLYLGSLGHNVTGVDVGAPAIDIAQQKAIERGLADQVQFLAFDALQLPKPRTPVDFIYDNTVYCNLRFEFLEKVLSMLERLTTPGHTLYMLNCGNANDRGLVSGHPRLRRQAIEADLEGLFDVLKVYEGVYDMDLSGTTAKHASKWNKEKRGVLSWTMIFRRKKMT